MWGKSSIPLRDTSGHTRHTKIQALRSVDTDRCQECLRAAPSHGIVLWEDDIPQLCKSWDVNITDLVSGIPLKLPPIWEINHEINLNDPEKHMLENSPDQNIVGRFYISKEYFIFGKLIKYFKCSSTFQCIFPS